MELKNYIAVLQKFVDENPNAGNLTVLYSVDEEGNSYQKLHITEPSLAHAADLEDYIIEDLFFTDDMEEHNTEVKAYGGEVLSVNCVVIN